MEPEEHKDLRRLKRALLAPLLVSLSIAKVALRFERRFLPFEFSDARSEWAPSSSRHLYDCWLSRDIFEHLDLIRIKMEACSGR